MNEKSDKPTKQSAEPDQSAAQDQPKYREVSQKVKQILVTAFLLLLPVSQLLARTVFLESGGQVVVEAENFSERTSTTTHEWFSVPTGGLFINSRGDGYIQALPDNGVGSAALQPPLADYTIRVTTVGTYRLYARWDSNADGSDSFYASVVELKDGSGGPIADWYRYVSVPDDADFATRPWHGSAGFERTDAVGGDTTVLWTITEPGDYTIRFDMREDGAAIDAFVFQLASLPAPIGDGPPESQIVEDLAITTTLSAVKVGELFSQQLEATGGVGPLTWSVSDGALPSDVELTIDGVLSGTPTGVGESTFTLTVTDSNGDTAAKIFTLEVVLIFPPPDIRIRKVGTIPVPGRTLDYFILVENTGVTTVNDFEILEPLNPAHFDLLAASPDPIEDISTHAEAAAVLWKLDSLKPGKVAILTYQVTLKPTVPIGTIVSGGPACGGFELLEIWSGCLLTAITAVPPCAPCVGTCSFCKPPVCPAGGPACWTCLGFCATTCAGVPGPGGKSCVESAWGVATSCFEAKQKSDMCDSNDEEATQPVDPNEKLVIAERFIQPDQTLVYPIHFENISPDIEAIDVFVTDVLGPNLDDSTLKILSPGGSYDPTTRTLRWELLGRNLQPGETDNVLLSIKPLPGLPSGTEIRNSAEIQFEIFDPLETETVVNIIDTTSPSCVMDPLPTQVTSVDIPLSWSGRDDIGEIKSHSLFVSVDDSVFSPLLETADSEMVFTGEFGRMYEFFCVAKDTAGNIEANDAVAEAVTQIVLPATSRRRGCFIATAAYGSYLHPHVKALRRLRDNYLLTNLVGKAFVSFYDDASPPVAALIERHEALKIVTRTALTPLVYVVSYPLKAAVLSVVVIGLLGYWFRRRRRPS